MTSSPRPPPCDLKTYQAQSPPKSVCCNQNPLHFFSLSSWVIFSSPQESSCPSCPGFQLLSPHNVFFNANALCPHFFLSLLFSSAFCIITWFSPGTINSPIFHKQFFFFFCISHIMYFRHSTKHWLFSRSPLLLSYHNFFASPTVKTKSSDNNKPCLF